MNRKEYYTNMVHKYEELANRLRNDINSGDYIEGQCLPSENELATQTGYSRQTVRQAIRVLQNESLVNCVQGSGTYVKKNSAPREDTFNIAVVTTYIGEYIFPLILQGINKVLSQNGYTTMLSATYNRVENERKILSELLKKPIDGIIVEGTKTALPNPNLDLYQQFTKRGIPMVFINGIYPELQEAVLYVVADDCEGGHMACDFLLKKGHRNIAGIFKSDDIQGHRRYKGYVEALHKAEISVIDERVLWYNTENSDYLIENVIFRIIEGCTAIVCYNDRIAMDVIRFLQVRNIRVPKDIEIMSFDNSYISQGPTSSFYSLTNQKELIGSMAAEKILDSLKGKKVVSTVLPWIE